MAKPKFGLGRGLDALISGASEVMAAQQPARAHDQSVLLVPIESVLPNPRQPRKIFREDDPRLLELSASIKEHGLLQPLLVTRLNSPGAPPAKAVREEGGWFSENEATAAAPPVEGVPEFQIIAGERRWRASRLAGLSKIPVMVKEVTPQEMLELALIENIQRADLNPIEEALAYQTLMNEFGLTQDQVAQQVGKDRTTIANSVRLLQLAPKVREALVSQYEHFTEGHARALIGIAREEDQLTAMGQIIALRLNVRQAEELARRIKLAEAHAESAHEIPAISRHSGDLDDLETQFRDALMVKVDLKRGAKGRGTLVLHFNNQDELERLYSRLVKQENS